MAFLSCGAISEIDNATRMLKTIRRRTRQSKMSNRVRIVVVLGLTSANVNDFRIVYVFQNGQRRWLVISLFGHPSWFLFSKRRRNDGLTTLRTPARKLYKYLFLHLDMAQISVSLVLLRYYLEPSTNRTSWIALRAVALNSYTIDLAVGSCDAC